MEKTKARRKNNHIGHQLCFPIHRASTSTCIHPAASTSHHDHHRTARTSLLERIREAIFSHIMAFAISNSKAAPGLADPAPAKTSVLQQSHQCDAVAECIEFIKKTTAPASTEHEPPLSPSNVSAAADHSGSGGRVQW